MTDHLRLATRPALRTPLLLTGAGALAAALFTALALLPTTAGAGPLRVAGTPSPPVTLYDFESGRPSWQAPSGVAMTIVTTPRANTGARALRVKSLLGYDQPGPSFAVPLRASAQVVTVHVRLLPGQSPTSFALRSPLYTAVPTRVDADGAWHAVSILVPPRGQTASPAPSDPQSTRLELREVGHCPPGHDAASKVLLDTVTATPAPGTYVPPPQPTWVCPALFPVLTNDFEGDDPQGWTPSTDTRAAVTTSAAHSGSASLDVWGLQLGQGSAEVRRDLATVGLVRGRVYEVSAWVLTGSRQRAAISVDAGVVGPTIATADGTGWTRLQARVAWRDPARAALRVTAHVTCRIPLHDDIAHLMLDGVTLTESPDQTAPVTASGSVSGVRVTAATATSTPTPTPTRTACA